jgi:hypothetical protein
VKPSAPKQKTTRADTVIQKTPSAGPQGISVAPPQNHTGLPDALKSGVESLSGLSLDDVRVHYNSPKPVQLQALAYTQGTDIHVAPGQERHLPHEAWHVVQQAQGRVRPTMKMMDGIKVNDDSGLEHEADVMGVKALHQKDDTLQRHVPTKIRRATLQKMTARIRREKGRAPTHDEIQEARKAAINNSKRLTGHGRSRHGKSVEVSMEKQQQQADKSLQNAIAETIQLKQDFGSVQLVRSQNHTGLPDALKSGVESLSGLALDDVRVHYNSSEPAQLQALVYTQGTKIHIAPGQERHIPHEAWHVVQQKQGRVRSTMNMMEADINNDTVLEREAEMMGVEAGQLGLKPESLILPLPGSPVQPKRDRSTIQRLGPNIAASSAGLVNQYNILLGSATFQQLNNKVTTNQDITLTDSSLLPGQPVDYDSGTHTIRVPLSTPAGLARPLPDIRDDILWEMHNASIRGPLARAGAKDSPLGGGASTVERKKYPYQRAAFALSFEWDEWINVVEHHIETQRINADPAMGGGGPHVRPTFAAYFAVADAGWFQFGNYLTVQIAAHHTTGYDPNAANPDWKGKKLLDIVQSASMAPLLITQKQVNDYLSGKTKKVKQVSNNPFMANALLLEAMRDG